uniref:Uncharacterized protein n=2 Tax=Phytophthora fragariae TaxID=53985 RepID=A0A6A3F963_9STRA|nr:hypothetical protein PF009_g8394 [Phytophthora fragariae]
MVVIQGPGVQTRTRTVSARKGPTSGWGRRVRTSDWGRRNDQHCVGVYAKSGEECEDESDDVYGGVHEIEHIDKSEDGQDEKRCDDNDGGHDKEYDKERSKLYGDASG